MKFVGPERDELDIDDRPLLRFEIVPPQVRTAGFIDMRERLTREAFFWCCEQFGEAGLRKMECRWTHMTGFFWFREEADAFAFKMRWC